MRDDDRDAMDGFDYIAADGKAMNAHAGALVLPEKLMHDAMTGELSVIAVRLIQAAFGARDDCAGAGSNLLIQCVRTETLIGVRMIFVDAAPQIFPLLGNIGRTRRNAERPTPGMHRRSLSRRQLDVLQMIARGKSNKCNARTLGITPETVKTHVKNIFSKLKTRTRAQAVASAEAMGFL